MDGFEVCRLLPSNGAGPAVVLVSSRDACRLRRPDRAERRPGLHREGRAVRKRGVRPARMRHSALLLAAGVAVGAAASVGPRPARPHERPRGQQGRDARARAHRGGLLHRQRPDRAWRRPENRTGLLLASVGYLWVLGALNESNNDWVFTAGVALGGLAFGAFAHLLLAFPWGVLHETPRPVLVVSAYALTFFGSVATAAASTRRPPPTARRAEARSPSPTTTTASNVFTVVVHGSRARAPRGDARHRRAAVRAGLARAAARPRPVFGAGTLAVAVLVLGLVVDSIDSGAADPLEYVFLASFAMVPIAFLAGILRSRLARAATGDLLLELARGTPLRDALADALERPVARDRVLAAGAEPLRLGGRQGDPRATSRGRRTTSSSTADGRSPRSSTTRRSPTSRSSSRPSPRPPVSGSTTSASRRTSARRSHFLDTVVNTSPSLLCALDLDGRIANSTRACGNASGCEDPEDDRQRQYFWDIFSAPAEREEWTRTVRGGGAGPRADRVRDTRSSTRGASELVDRVVDRADLRRRRERAQHHLRRARRHRAQAAGGRARRASATSCATSPTRRRACSSSSTRRDGRRQLRQQVLRADDRLERAGRCSGAASSSIVQPEDEGYSPGSASRRAFAGAEPRSGVSRWRTRNGGERIDRLDGDADRRRRPARSSRSSAGSTSRSASGARQTCVRARSACGRRSRPLRSRSSSTRSTTRITRWNPAAERIFGWTAERSSADSRSTSRRDGRRSSPSSSAASAPARSTWASRADACARTARTSTSRSPPRRSATPPATCSATWLSSRTSRDRKRHEEEVHASRARIVQAGDDARRVLERNLHDGAQQRLVSLSLSLRLAQRRRLEDRPEEARELDVRRPRGADARDRGPARARARNPSGRAHRPRAGRGARCPRLALARAGRDRGARRAAAARRWRPPPTTSSPSRWRTWPSTPRASSASVRVSSEDGHALIEVTDDGVGGADSGRRHRAERPRRPRRRARRHLVVDSPPGGGTCVTAVFPL